MKGRPAEGNSEGAGEGEGDKDQERLGEIATHQDRNLALAHWPSAILSSLLQHCTGVNRGCYAIPIGVGVHGIAHHLACTLFWPKVAVANLHPQAATTTCLVEACNIDLHRGSTRCIRTTPRHRTCLSSLNFWQGLSSLPSWVPRPSLPPLSSSASQHRELRFKARGTSSTRARRRKLNHHRPAARVEPPVETPDTRQRRQKQRQRYYQQGLSNTDLTWCRRIRISISGAHSCTLLQAHDHCRPSIDLPPPNRSSHQTSLLQGSRKTPHRTPSHRAANIPSSGHRHRHL